jgi:DNA-binding response OmpR family regulator
MDNGKNNILVVEDEPDYRDLINRFLQDTYNVFFAENGIEGFRMATGDVVPDLVIIDIQLPVLNGYDLCRMLRENEKTRNLPLLILTGAELRDELKSFEVGADDFIEKPISRERLMARIESKIQRFKQLAGGEKLTCSGVLLNPSTMTVSFQDKTIELTALEYRLLKFLFENQGKIVSRDKILVATWGDDSNVSYRTVDVHFTNLRKKLRDLPLVIKSKYAAGYILTHDEKE